MNIIFPISDPSAIFTMNACSAHNIIADSSFLSIVSDIIFDLAAKREHNQTPGLNSSPALMAASLQILWHQLSILILSETGILWN